MPFVDTSEHVKLAYCPFHLSHTHLLFPDGALQPVFLLTGGDERLHVYAVVRAAMCASLTPCAHEPKQKADGPLPRGVRVRTNARTRLPSGLWRCRMPLPPSFPSLKAWAPSTSAPAFFMPIVPMPLMQPVFERRWGWENTERVAS